MAHGELACLFHEPHTGFDHCLRMLQVCFRKRMSARGTSSSPSTTRTSDWGSQTAQTASTSTSRCRTTLKVGRNRGTWKTFSHLQSPSKRSFPGFEIDILQCSAQLKVHCGKTFKPANIGIWEIPFWGTQYNNVLNPYMHNCICMRRQQKASIRLKMNGKHVWQRLVSFFPSESVGLGARSKFIKCCLSNSGMLKMNERRKC